VSLLPRRIGVNVGSVVIHRRIQRLVESTLIVFCPVSVRTKRSYSFSRFLSHLFGHWLRSDIWFKPLTQNLPWLFSKQLSWAIRIIVLVSFKLLRLIRRRRAIQVNLLAILITRRGCGQIIVWLKLKLHLLRDELVWVVIGRHLSDLLRREVPLSRREKWGFFRRFYSRLTYLILCTFFKVLSIFQNSLSFFQVLYSFDKLVVVIDL
jgi:hypothetical protein